MAEETDTTHLGDGFNIHTDINSIRIDKKGSIRSRAILFLSLLSLWIPTIPSIVALAMIPSARREIENSNGKLTGLRMISWGKAISLIMLTLNVLSVLILALLYLFAGDLFTRACAIDAQYCQYIKYTVH